AAFGYTFLVIGLHGWERGFGPAFWLLLALNFLVYPHLVYVYARLAREPKHTEGFAMYADAVLLGAWSAGLHFPIWISYAVLFSTTLNAISLGGIPRGLVALGCFCFGAALAVAGLGAGYQPAT